jgi:predicted transcriptional regulator
MIHMADPGMLSLFKALADASRLRLVGLLADRSYTVEQLSALLDLRASTVSHHLSRLAQVGLVSAQADGYYSVYRLEANQLESFAKRLLEPETLARFADGVDRDAYDHRVLDNFVRGDGSLREIPAQCKKRAVILRYILRAFQSEKRYSEAQVNVILARYHDDTATLRRELVGLGWMACEASVYWRVKESARPRDQSTTWSVW